ncbi:MAG: flagellar basal body rod protein FlgB [Firmicutes bacterium]|nr:flagellar basal body rod protein FlgB [Bacillota bacterium]
MEWTSRVLAQALDGLSLRHRVLANNFANVNTPGFKRSDVNFESAMKEFLTGGTTKAEFKVVADNSTTMRNDDNNVDPEQELAKLTANAILYKALAEQINRKFGQLRMVVREGR